VGFAQRRLALKPERMVSTIYGIVSDGVRWHFLRLEDKLLLVSDRYSLVSPDGKKNM
jgi:hypothetical protein